MGENNQLHWNIFQQILNFTYDLTKPPDEQWGSIQPDNSWSGTVGMLIAEEIDMGINYDNSYKKHCNRSNIYCDSILALVQTYGL